MRIEDLTEEDRKWLKTKAIREIIPTNVHLKVGVNK